RAAARLRALARRAGRRLACASGLAAYPGVLLLHQPVAGPAAESAAALFSLLRDRAESGVPVLFTTDKWRLAQEHADDLVVLSHGRVIANGTFDDLQGEEKLYVARFPDPAAARAARDRIDEGAEPVAKENEVTFTAAEDEAAVKIMRSVEGVRAFGPVNRDLADLFKESV